MKLHASQQRQQTLATPRTYVTPAHHTTTIQTKKKQTIFHNNNYTRKLDTTPGTTKQETIKTNIAQIHTEIFTSYIQTIPHNKVLNSTLPEISTTEQALPHYTRRLLQQLRTNKSPILQAYQLKIAPGTHTTSNCPLCHLHSHDTPHIVGCARLLADLGPRHCGTTREARAPTPGIWLLGGWLSGLRVRECVLCTYSYVGGRLADWLAPLRVRAYVRCRCRFTKVKHFSC